MLATSLENFHQCLIPPSHIQYLNESKFSSIDTRQDSYYTGLNIHVCNKYQPSGAGGTRLPPATTQRLQKSKMDERGPQNGQRGLLLGFWVLPSTFTK